MITLLILIPLLLASLAITAGEGDGGGAASTATLDGILGPGELIGQPAQGTDSGAAEGQEQQTGTEEEVAAEGESVEGEAEAAEGSEAEGQDQEFEEVDLAPEEGEVDYSDEVYDRYAQHFSKQWKQQLDPTNPIHRAALREIIQRGQNALAATSRLNELQQQRESGEDESQAEAEEQQAESGEASQVDTPEQVQQFLQQVDNFVDPRIRPEIAKKFTTDFMTALWGEKGAQMAEKTPPEAQKKFTKVLTSFGYLLLNDALPQILESYIPGFLSNNYPGFDQVQQDAVNESALMGLLDARDGAGNEMYPDLNWFVFGDNPDDNQPSPLEQVYASNPWLKNYKFADQRGRLLPPVEQAQRRLEIAYGMARGQAPPEELMRGAVEAGRRQERRQARVTGAGRLAPGDTGGTFDRQGDSTDQLMNGMQQFGDRDRQIQDMLAPKPR